MSHLKLLASGATTTVNRLLSDGYGDVLGCLRVPGETPDTVPIHAEWAMDNGCYSGLDALSICRLLGQCAELHEYDQPHFITVPDTVCDWNATIDFFMEFRFWCFELYGSPPWHLAVVLQDGIDLKDDRWTFADALFVGGSDHEFKLRYCEPILQEAANNGTWVHVGRINSKKNIRRMFDMGCVHSFDGSGYSRWPDANLVPAVKYLRSLDKQRSLF